ncbi:MAG: hypothetical protein IT581_10775 [Verrucomicrobiales bacterium]|nr:hypothetical protein [Verrucomicrobiales bacterium]
MQYSAAMQWVLIVAWLSASAGIAWRPRWARTACVGAAIAAAPAVAYSMLGYGLLPMGGLVHVGVAGLYGGVLHWIVARWKKSKRTPEGSDVE